MPGKPKYETIFHSELLKAVELVLNPELTQYHSVADIIPTTDRKRWIVELHLDHRKRVKNVKAKEYRVTGTIEDCHKRPAGSD